MTYQCHYESSPDVGVFITLTNKYCITAPHESVQLFSLLESVLAPHGLPVFRTSIGHSNIIGRMTVGNSKGLLVPATTRDFELMHIRNSLPDDVIVQKLDDRLSALGNVIACNDYVALIHPDLDRESEEIIQDVLGVETFRHSIAGLPLVGSYCRFTNKGCLVQPGCSREEQEELASLLGVQVCSGTVNRGATAVAGGCVVNDFVGFVGRECTNTEIGVIQAVFGLQQSLSAIDDMKRALAEGFL